MDNGKSEDCKNEIFFYVLPSGVKNVCNITSMAVYMCCVCVCVCAGALFVNKL